MPWALLTGLVITMGFSSWLHAAEPAWPDDHWLIKHSFGATNESYALTMAPAPGLSGTFISRLAVAGDMAAIGTNNLWLAGFSFNAGQPPTDLVLSWEQYQTFLIPAWRLRLRAQPGLLPAALINGVDYYRETPSEYIDLNLPATTEPQPGHIYETMLAYSSKDLAVAVRLMDTSAGHTLFQATFPLNRLAGPLYPGAGGTGQPRNDYAREPAIVFHHLQLAPDYTSLGLPWSLQTSFTWQLLKQSGPSYAPTFGAVFHRSDSLAVDLRWPPQPLPGRMAVHLESSGQSMLLGAYEWSGDGQQLLIDPDIIPAGNWRLRLTYDDGRAVHEFGARELRMIDGTIKVALAELRSTGDVIVGNVVVSSDRPVGAVPLQLRVVVKDVTGKQAPATIDLQFDLSAVQPAPINVTVQLPSVPANVMTIELLPQVPTRPDLAAQVEGGPLMLAKADNYSLDQATLQSMLDFAAAHGGLVRIPPGTHRIERGADPSWHLRINNADDLVVDGTGATLVFTDPAAGGIHITNSRRVTLRGFSMDWDPLPFTQGTIVGFDPGGAWYDMQIDPGYPDDPALLARLFRMNIIDPATGTLKYDTYDMWADAVEIPRTGVLRTIFTKVRRTSEAYHVEVGDRAVISYRGGVTAIRLDNAENCLVDAVTIHSSPDMAVLEAGGAGGSTYRYRITPGPLPAGAQTARLLSTNADGFHSSGVQKGPLLENCLFEFMGDDSVNIHGIFDMIVGAGNGGRTLIVSTKGGLNVLPGDRLRVYSAGAPRLLGERRVLAVTAAFDAAFSAEAARLWAADKGNNDYPLFTVELDAPVAAEKGGLITSPDHAGNGAVVRNCTFRDHRARGVLIQSANALIEGNVLERIAQAGIIVGPEIYHWYEADYAQNVVVRNNILRDIGTSALGRHYRLFAIGAITVGVDNLVEGLPAGRENHNIRIEGNLIERSALAGLFINSASGVEVAGNTFRDTNFLHPLTAGGMYQIKPSAAIIVSQSDHVSFTGNVVERLGPFGEQAALIHPSADTETIDTTGIEIRNSH